MRIRSYAHACDHTHMHAFRPTYRGHFEISWCHQTNDPNMTEVAIQRFTVCRYSLLGTSEDVKPSQCSLKLEPIRQSMYTCIPCTCTCGKWVNLWSTMHLHTLHCYTHTYHLTLPPHPPTSGSPPGRLYRVKTCGFTRVQHTGGWRIHQGPSLPLG